MQTVNPIPSKPTEFPPDESTFVEELVFRCLQAEDPRVALAAHAAEPPALAPRIRRAFGQLERQGLLPQDASSLDEIPERLGQFRLQRKIGAGGMGIVFLAEDEELRRRVALKVIRPEQVFFQGARERFQREVETIASLQHPGIVPVYEVGRHDGIPYFAMEYVEGCSLADVIAALQKSESPPSGCALMETVERHAGDVRKTATSNDTSTRLGNKSWSETCIALVAQVASTVHHAHERGILHRDIKPSNILVTPNGRARVVDFGLAWTDQEGQRLTKTSSQLGSLPYLPPECVSGKMPDPSRRVDVYSLGVTLYELLTLRSPFLADSQHETRRRILEARPLPPRKMDRSIPHELETVCLVAMDPDPTERYATAAEFQRDLERVRDHEPISACRPGFFLRARRWTQRHRTLSTAVAVAFVLTTIAVLAFGLSERSARIEADRLTSIAQQERYGALLSAANVELGAGLRPGVARRLLGDCRSEYRGWEWRYLEFASNEAVRKITGFRAPIEAIAWSPDGDRFVTTSQDGALVFWDSDGREIRRVEGDTSMVAFRPGTEGRELVTGSMTGRLTARDAATGAVIGGFQTKDPSGGTDRKLGGQVVAIAFTPDGRQLFTTSTDGRVVAWDAVKRSWKSDIGKHRLRAHSLDVSRDGRLIASGGYDSTVHIYDGKTLEQTKTLRLLPKDWRGMPRFVLDLQFGPDGKRLFVADVGTLKAFDLESEDGRAQVIDREYRHTMALALSPDGKHLAAIVGQRALQIYETRGRHSRVERLIGHEGLVMSLAYHPDGRRILSGGSHHIARLWEPGHGAEGALRVHLRYVNAVTSPDADTILSASSRGELCRTRISTGETTRLVAESTEASSKIVCVFPAGKGAAFSLEVGGRLRLWLGDGTEPTKEFATAAGVTAAVRCGTDRVAIATQDGALSLWSLADGRKLRSWNAHKSQVHCLAADASGEQLWSAAVDGSMLQWNTSSGALIRSFATHPAWISALVVSPSGAWIASACADTNVRVFDNATGALLHVLQGHGRTPLGLAAMPTGDRLVSSGGYDNELRIWNPRSGRCLLSLVSRPATTALALSADGERIICGTSVGPVRWLRARPGGPQEIEAPRRGGELDTMTSRPDRVRHR